MSQRSVAIASIKGGVGKTTIALNLAYALAKRGRRTLLVDTDPQGALGLSLMGALRERAGLAGIVQGADPAAEMISTKLPELRLLPMGHVAPIDIDSFAQELARTEALRRVMDACASDTDIVLFDTPAGLGGTTRKVLEVVESVLLPVQCEPLSLRALPSALELLASLRQGGAQCSLLGVLANMSSFRDPVVLEVLEEVWSLYERAILDTSIPKDRVFLDASRAGVPVGLLSRRPPPASMVFDKLAAELEERLGLNEGDADDGPISLLD